MSTLIDNHPAWSFFCLIVIIHLTIGVLSLFWDRAVRWHVQLQSLKRSKWKEWHNDRTR